MSRKRNDNQPDLFDLRHMTHTDDPETSQIAAETVAPRLTEIQRRVLVLFDDLGPMADHELHAAYVHRYAHYVAYSTVRTRRCELRDQGRVKETDERRPVPITGNPAVVWRLAL